MRASSTFSVGESMRGRARDQSSLDLHGGDSQGKFERLLVIDNEGEDRTVNDQGKSTTRTKGANGEE